MATDRANTAAYIEQLEAELARTRYERDMLQALLDREPFFCYIRDMEYRYVFSNKAHREMMGEPLLENVIGKKVGDFFPEEYARSYEEDDRQVIEAGQEVIDRVSETELDDGQILWRRTNKYPVKDKDNQIIGMVGMTVDFTEEKQKLDQIEAQQLALRELGSPIIPIVDGIVILPLIGNIDSQRSVDIMRAVLSGITQYTAQVIIIDITGVPIVDTGVASHFNRTIQAVRLKGATAIITGITEEVAETIVDLGIDWGDIITLPDLQSGLKFAIEQHTHM